MSMNSFSSTEWSKTYFDRDPAYEKRGSEQTHDQFPLSHIPWRHDHFVHFE